MWTLDKYHHSQKRSLPGTRPQRQQQRVKLAQFKSFLLSSAIFAADTAIPFTPALTIAGYGKVSHHKANIWLQYTKSI